MATNKVVVNLDGEWQLNAFPEGRYVIEQPGDLDHLDLSPIPARVPGNVEIDLLNAGLIPEPFWSTNFQELRKFETYEWWYRRKFNFKRRSDQENYQLVLAGLDTFGTVWVNGKKIGQPQNMLIEHNFIVHNLMEGENQIDIRIQSALNHSRFHQYEPSMMSWENREEGLFVRKAPHVWGWDIMPRIVSAGIWRSIWIEAIPDIGFEQLYFWTAELNTPNVVLGMWFQFKTTDSNLNGYNLDVYGICEDHEFKCSWPVEFTTGRCLIPIQDARLWWPKGYGLPNIYKVRVQLRRDGEVLDQKVETIGIRKVEVLRSEKVNTHWKVKPTDQFPCQIDSPTVTDSQFIVKINHLPIMVKGTNWVPLDAFHSRDASRLERGLALANDLGCNMIRCWGGNVYEDTSFFAACDRYGMMVWQDFAFACCRYPQTEAFFEMVRSEAEVIVGKLRNHPSLVLWCGDNEIDMTYLSDGLSPESNRINREVLPQVLHRLDPYRAYIPSSPHISPMAFCDDNPWTAIPEQHLWGPRGYYKNPFYSDHTAHFIGEIGYHGCPQVTSIQSFISQEKLWPFPTSEATKLSGNDEWQAHAVYHWQHQGITRDRIQLMANQVGELFGEIPGNLLDFVIASQICQAEAFKYFIESTRQRKWHTSGILWWNLIDGWPQFSDAVVDYYFAKKLAYHYIRRVQQPVCVILGEPGPGKSLPILVSNDSNRPVKGSYQVWDADTGVVASEGFFEVPANQNWQFDRVRTFASEQRLYLIQWNVDGKSFGNHYMVGNPPIQLEQYRDWLFKIAQLPEAFDIDI